MKRTRLSLETTQDFKGEVHSHRRQLGESSIIGTLRAALRRSIALSHAVRNGGTLVVREKDGTYNDVVL
jgi:hypothetical protein